MSDITLVGLNHKTAAVELREALAFTAEESSDALKSLIKGEQNSKIITEAMLFSTCNRMEILFTSAKQNSEKLSSGDKELSENSTQYVINFLSKYKNVPVSRFHDSLYIYRGGDAIRHLFRVASSLDSMIIGEPQILGQVKAAYRFAVSSNSSGVVINRLMHKAFSIAKRVRRETGIGDNAVSISYAAIELANKIFSDLSDRSVMLLGAGEMAELAVEHLISHGVKKIVVANRTFENAVNLAQRFNGINSSNSSRRCGAQNFLNIEDRVKSGKKDIVSAEPVRFEEREDKLKDVDIIISSTGATDYVLRASHVKKIMSLRKSKPLFFIDIAVPRDIDPEIHKIDNAYLYDIDDLQNIVDDNMDERKKEAIKGERLVDEAVIKFQRWLGNLDVVPTIVAIKEKIEKITASETEKTLSSLHLGEHEQEAIKRMTRAITSKIMHDPIRFLKNTGSHRDDAFYLNAAREIFNINNINGDY
ncbi:MAG: glutamyl-tRNA reductase [Desulfamplus sp.]|nr:glutamyl-tRNA reductase [Desulfamplus sp.]MBF0389334.1 glutamyl-tRNA reductase [Desulfamplus sp.]